MTLHEKKQYDQLRALARYQKIGSGPEALLFKKMLERRKAVCRVFFLYFAYTERLFDSSIQKLF